MSRELDTSRLVCKHVYALWDVPMAKNTAEMFVTLHRVTLNRDGYDRDGCYWGIGLPLYYHSSFDGSVEGYLRASDRESAVFKAEKLHQPGSWFR
jgi:hypothetical protein